MSTSPLDVLDAQLVASGSRAAQLPASAFAEIAFAGRSNVGKSSLLNTLASRKKLVRTSSTPGCTRTINLFRVSLRAGAVIDLVDLPGYGFAKVSKDEKKSWGRTMEEFLRRREGLRAVAVLIDARRGIEEDDEALLEFVAHIGREPVVVATKIDKIPSSKRKAQLDALAHGAGFPVTRFSAVSGEGRDPLWERLLSAAHIELSPEKKKPEKEKSS